MIKVLTLFGEEIIPEDYEVVPKKRGRQRAADASQEQDEANPTVDTQTEEKPVSALERARKAITATNKIAAREEPVEEPAEVQAITEEEPIIEEVVIDLFTLPTVAENVPNIAAIEVEAALPQPEIEQSPEEPVVSEIKNEALPSAPEMEQWASELAVSEIKDEVAAVEPATAESEPKLPRKKRPIKKARAKNIIPNLSEPEILKGWAPTKQYYPIGEVAELFNVATSHIRYWTNEFGIRVRTTKKGDRMYSAEHIQVLRTIYHLTKERGFTLAGAKTKLKEDKKAPPAQSIDINHSLLQLRKQLVAIREQLA